MKIDNGYFYDMEPDVDLVHFVELLLLTLAKRDTMLLSFKETRATRRAILPTDYKEKIQEAMYSEKAIKFLKLISSYQYYEKQSDWELKLADAFKEYMKMSGKTAKYNFEFDRIEFLYTETEIFEILKKYDEQTIALMEELVWFIGYDYSDSRYHNLVWEETKRNGGRKYIATSATTFAKDWTPFNKKEDKSAKIVVSHQYTKK